MNGTTISLPSLLGGWVVPKILSPKFRVPLSKSSTFAFWIILLTYLSPKNLLSMTSGNVPVRYLAKVSPDLPSLSNALAVFAFGLLNCLLNISTVASLASTEFSFANTFSIFEVDNLVKSFGIFPLPPSPILEKSPWTGCMPDIFCLVTVFWLITTSVNVETRSVGLEVIGFPSAPFNCAAPNVFLTSALLWGEGSTSSPIFADANGSSPPTLTSLPGKSFPNVAPV